MRERKTLKWIIVGLVLAFLLLTGVVYLQSIRIPSNYRPIRLSAARKKQVVKEFWSKIQQFGNDAQLNDPYEWNLTQRELNQYFAAIDEIVASTPSGKSGQVHRTMDRAGIVEPAIDFVDGMLIVMVRSKKHSRIISTELEFYYDEDKLKINLKDVRLGRLCLPEFWVKSGLKKLKQLIPPPEQKQEDPEGEKAGVLTSQDFSEFLGEIIAGIEGVPLRTELTWPINKKKVRIDRVEIINRELKCSILPIDRD